MSDYDENNDIKEEEFQGDESQENELSELEKLRQENQQNLEGWQRARADYSNLQKTHNEQIKNLKSYVVGNMVEDLLPVLDSFGMAMGNKEVWEKVDANWRMGIEYILKQFTEALEKNGVTEIETKEGDAFDPEKHQALETVETEDESQNEKVAQVMQKGYKMGDTVLRPVKVKTFKKKE